MIRTGIKHLRVAKALPMAGLLVALVAVALVATVNAQDMEEERYEAFAVHMGTGPTGSTTIQMVITRWSTPEEREELLKVFAEGGQEKLSDALGDQDETGFIRFPRARTRFPSTRLHYAWQFQDGDTRVIRLLTNRPIGYWEAINQTRSFDYDLTMIELRLDEDNRGEGALAVGIEVKYDKEKNQISIENYTSSPVRLNEVHRTN